MNKLPRVGLATLSILLAGVVGTPTLAQAQSQGALSNFVYQADPAYGFTPVAQLPGPGFTVHLLRLDSQTWRDASEVSPTLWSHWLTVLVPDQILTPTAHMWILGGSQSTTPPTPQEISLFAPVSVATGAVMAILSEVPGQPLSFTDRPGSSMREDELVAYTWDKAMTTGDPTWTAYFPMTKATVRAMDATQTYIQGLLGAAPPDFIVTGFSKRGATAWLTAAIDPRVRAVVPGVFNALHLGDQLEHHFNSYGFYAPAVVDYTNENIFSRLRSPEGRFLESVVDPVSFASTLTMPHFLLQASGDEFFLPDSSQRFIDDIPGQTVQRIVPNESHGFERDLNGALFGLVAWYQSILTSTPIPVIEDELDATGTLEITSDQTPLQAVLWQANNPTARDFRRESIGDAWVPTPLIPDADGVYRVTVPTPTAGFSAYLVEFAYPGVGGIPQLYTTSTYVTPDVEPFELNDPIASPRLAAFWKRQVRAAQGARTGRAPIEYSAQQLEALLPIRVFGTYRRTLADLSGSLRAGWSWSKVAERQCVAARLNIESQRLGWHSDVSVRVRRQTIADKLWVIYERAEAAASAGRPAEAATLCLQLSLAR